VVDNNISDYIGIVQDECYEHQECAGDYKQFTHTVMNTMTTTPHDQAINQGWGVPQSSMLAQLKREQLPTDKHLVLFDKYK